MAPLESPHAAAARRSKMFGNLEEDSVAANLDAGPLELTQAELAHEIPDRPFFGEVQARASALGTGRQAGQQAEESEKRDERARYAWTRWMEHMPGESNGCAMIFQVILTGSGATRPPKAATPPS
jgi:hypothetical protein